MSDAPTPDAVAAWRSLIDTQALVVERVEAALAAAGLPALAWYDVLWTLRASPEARLRQSELVRAVVMSRSGLSRLVDRIEAAGLVRREACPDDRRGTEVVLTPAGRAMQRRMWPVYGACLTEDFAAHVEDPIALAGLLEPVAAALRGGGQAARRDQPAAIIRSASATRSGASTSGRS